MRTSRVLLHRPLKGGKGKLQTKRSVSKRFQMTSRGQIKCWPSKMKGKKKLLPNRGLAAHMADLMPYSKGRNRWIGPERPVFSKIDIFHSSQRIFKKKLGREMTPREIDVVAEVISKARVVGNRVYPGEGQSVLKVTRSKQ